MSKKRNKTVSIDLSKKETSMATEDQNQQSGDAAAENDKPDTATQDTSGNSQEPGSVQATSASTQLDTTVSSGAASSTDSALVATIAAQNQAVVDTIAPAAAPAGDIVDVNKSAASEDAVDNDVEKGDSVDTGSTDNSENDEVKPVVPADPAPTAPAPAAPAPATVLAASTAPASEQTDGVSLNPVSDLLNQNLLKKDPSFKAQVILDSLKEYMEGMKAGKPVAQAVQVKHQRALQSLITQTINDLDDTEFKPVFDVICKAFAEDPTGCFADTHVYRGWSALNMTAKARTSFEFLVKTIMTLAPVKGRGIAKNHINIELALKNGINERGRHRMIDYFNFQ